MTEVLSLRSQKGRAFSFLFGLGPTGSILIVAALQISGCNGGKTVTTPGTAFGEYDREPVYRQFVRSSLYVPVRDGTKLAVDVFRPAVDGVAVAEPLPVLFTYSRYWRATEHPDGSIATNLGVLEPGQTMGSLEGPFDRPSVPHLVSRGYVYAQADGRGTGASYGYFYGEMSGVEARDGHDIVEWLGVQPWSDGKVGMIGASYPGMTQFLVAAEAPPHLKAIFPSVVIFDEYRVLWSGSGILRKYGLAWLATNARRDGVAKGKEGSTINPLDREQNMVARVDNDTTGAMLNTARAERHDNPDGTNPLDYVTAQVPAFGEMYRNVREQVGISSEADLLETLYSTELLQQALTSRPALAEKLFRMKLTRDEAPMLTQPEPEGRNNLAALVDRINAAGIPAYNWGGIRDFATLDTFLWFANLTAPQKITMGPWTHGPNEPDDPREEASKALYPVEQLRWFDYWLKGIDTGIMKEPAIRYAVMDSKKRWEWRTADEWPLAEAVSTRFYLSPGPSGSVQSVNDGLLSNEPPEGGSDTFTVDYTATMGPHTRYHDAIGFGPQSYPDLEAHARTALSYTTPPLEQATVLAGHPVITFYVSSSAEDGEFDCYLEEVDADGTVRYLTDGVMKASHRKRGTPFYEKLGLPWSSSTKADVDAAEPLTTSVAELTFDLQPTANLFEAGHRIRIVITGADAHTNLTIPLAPPPDLTVWHGGDRASHVVLPMIPAATP